jgi:hypothetical protein
MGVAACQSDLEKKASSDCFSEVTDYSSPGAGILMLKGHFYHTESILVRDADTHAQVAGGTPDTDRSTFTFTGVPSGSHYYEVIASCDGGQSTLVTQTFDVM